MHSSDKASFDETGSIFVVTYISPKWMIFFKKVIPSLSKAKYLFNNFYFIYLLYLIYLFTASNSKAQKKTLYENIFLKFILLNIDLN